MKIYWSLHWVSKYDAGGGRVETGLLQGEVPLGGLVGIVDQHQARIVAEAFRLLDHGDLVLTHKFRAEELGNRSDEGDMIENVPRGDDVDAASGCGDRGDGGERGEPLVSGADDLCAAVGQPEVDSRFDGMAVDAEQFVWRGVAAGGVGAHAEAPGDGLKAFGFLADAGTRTPPPGLMDERAVRRVHETDDAVIDVARQVGGEVGCAIAWAEFGKLRNRSLRGSTFPTCASGGNKDPCMAIALFARISGGENAGCVQLVEG